MAKKTAKAARQRRKPARPPVDFEVFAGVMDLVGALIESSGDVNTPDCSDLGCYVFNNGTAEEQAEGLLALFPVAARVHARVEARRMSAARAKRGAGKR